MARAGYQQFCPVAMAAELLCNRWTVVLLRELIAGSTRFNDLRRGVPTCHKAFDEPTALLCGDALQLVGRRGDCGVRSSGRRWQRLRPLLRDRLPLVAG